VLLRVLPCVRSVLIKVVGILTDMNMGSSPDGRGLVALSAPLRIEGVPGTKSVEESGISSGPGGSQERLGPSSFVISLVLGPLNSL